MDFESCFGDVIYSDPGMSKLCKSVRSQCLQQSAFSDEGNQTQET